MAERAPSTIRPTTSFDLPSLRGVIDRTDLFPSEMMEGMVAGYLDGSAPNDLWLTVVAESTAAGVAYYVPERLTNGTWNLLLIAVDPVLQGQGLGRDLMIHIENDLLKRNARQLLVETSGVPEFERTRTFYRRIGYQEEARIRDFYDVGQDKVVFRKVLF